MRSGQRLYSLQSAEQYRRTHIARDVERTPPAGDASVMTARRPLYALRRRDNLTTSGHLSPRVRRHTGRPWELVQARSHPVSRCGVNLARHPEMYLSGPQWQERHAVRPARPPPARLGLRSWDHLRGAVVLPRRRKFS